LDRSKAAGHGHLLMTPGAAVDRRSRRLPPASTYPACPWVAATWQRCRCSSWTTDGFL